MEGRLKTYTTLLRYTFSLLFVLVFVHKATAQIITTQETRTSDTLRFVEIIHADHMRQIFIDDSTQLQTLSGSAKVNEGGTFLDGDSIVINKRLGTIEVFGHVHLTDPRSADTRCEYLKYVGSEKKAYLNNNIQLSDGQSILYTQDLVYDMNTGIAKYENGGKVVSNKTVLTSRSAEYFTDSKDVIFRYNVRLKDPKYDMTADSLRYNTGFRTAYFISKTNIKTESGNITTRSGTYDMNTGEAVFLGKPVIKDKGRYITGSRVQFDDKNGMIEISGNGKVIDSSAKTMVKADQINIDRKQNTFLATQEAVMVLYDNNDSTFIKADTLFSGVMADSSTHRQQPDTKKDSIRFFRGYHHVRIYNDSVQAISDSLYYSSQDSCVKLFGKPVCWNLNTQLTGDTIILETENKKAKLLRVINNAMLINRTDQGFFNQMSGNTMKGFFKNGAIEKISTKGSPAESIFFPQDNDSAYVGMNRNKGDVIDVLFENKGISKVKFINEISGTLFPMNKIPAEMKKLKNFNWMDDQRPKLKSEFYRN